VGPPSGRIDRVRLVGPAAADRTARCDARGPAASISSRDRDHGPATPTVDRLRPGGGRVAQRGLSREAVRGFDTPGGIVPRGDREPAPQARTPGAHPRRDRQPGLRVEGVPVISRTPVATLDTVQEALRRICVSLVVLRGADTGAAYILTNTSGPAMRLPDCYHVPKEMMEKSSWPNRSSARGQGVCRDIGEGRRARLSDERGGRSAIHIELVPGPFASAGLVLPSAQRTLRGSRAPF